MHIAQIHIIYHVRDVETQTLNKSKEALTFGGIDSRCKIQCSLCYFNTGRASC